MRVAWALALWLTLAAGARAQDFTYDVTDARGAPRGELTVRRQGATLHVTGTLDGQALALQGQRLGDGWRVVLPPVQGLAGVLDGAQPQERVLLLRRAQGDVLVGRLETPGRAPEPLRGARRAPPAEECRPLRDRAWSRHGVATWEVGRALWDFFKPGSRRLEELRGPITQADTDALMERLRAAPRPWTPETIYGAAREISESDRVALQLSFALLVDQRALPLAPLPGLDPRHGVHDKYEHFFASAILAHRANATGSFSVGWLKEVLDEVSGSGYSEEDLTADALGAEFGQRLQCGAASR